MVGVDQGPAVLDDVAGEVVAQRPAPAAEPGRPLVDRRRDALDLPQPVRGPQPGEPGPHDDHVRLGRPGRRRAGRRGRDHPAGSEQTGRAHGIAPRDLAGRSRPAGRADDLVDRDAGAPGLLVRRQGARDPGGERSASSTCHRPSLAAAGRPCPCPARPGGAPSGAPVRHLRDGIRAGMTARANLRYRNLR